MILWGIKWLGCDEMTALRDFEFARFDEMTVLRDYCNKKTVLRDLSNWKSLRTVILLQLI